MLKFSISGRQAAVSALLSKSYSATAKWHKSRQFAGLQISRLGKSAAEKYVFYQYFNADCHQNDSASKFCLAFVFCAKKVADYNAAKRNCKSCAAY